MKVSYNWLKTFIEIKTDPHQLADALSLAGLEIEEVIEQRLDYPEVVIGKVLSKDRHPDADKLSLCTVDAGLEEPLSIICGAPNVAAGQTIAVAKIGAVLPNGLKIRKAKIRGVVSQGMICSEAELALSDDSDGIWVLPDGLRPGEALGTALAYEPDLIFDIAVTPNRPDCLSHLGIAREVAAIEGVTMDEPTAPVVESGELAAEKVVVEIDCPQSCPRYAARLIRNVKIGPSPDWMVRRLEAVGMRSINAIVDITNYVMLETGQPLHAFDYELISGRKIIVRESTAGESFVTLDEKRHKLQPGTVLICDADKAVALGGIMGGMNSEVSDKTRHILLESAHFASDNIRASLRYLQFNSEASQRFERGADPNGVIHALDRAAGLMAELTGAEVAAGVVDNYPSRIDPFPVPFKPEYINRLLGTSLSTAEMQTLLQSIGMAVSDSQVLAPTYRPDMRQAADVAEEVGRLYGYDNIPLSEYTAVPYAIDHNRFDAFVDRLKTILTGMGLQEVITNSMINRAEWEQLTGQEIYPILNPISNDMDGMRNSLVPSLLNVVRWNLNRRRKDLALFEINRIIPHPGTLKEQPDERLVLAVALTGRRASAAWTSDEQVFDFYDVKGAVEHLAAKISLDKLQFIAYDNFAVEGQSAGCLIAGKTVGFIGEVRSSVLRNFDIEQPVFVAEVEIQPLFQQTGALGRFQEIPKFPPAERDLAIVVDQHIDAGQLEAVIRQHAGKQLSEVQLFDIYSGKQVEAGKKSMAYRLVFQSHEKTLTEEEVNQSIDRILKMLGKQFSAVLRS